MDLIPPFTDSEMGLTEAAKACAQAILACSVVLKNVFEVTQVLDIAWRFFFKKRNVQSLTLMAIVTVKVSMLSGVWGCSF